MLSNPTLWQEICRYDFDRENSQTATDKLCRKLSWPPEKASKGLEEFRKFLYLAENGVMQSRPSYTLWSIWKVLSADNNGAWDGYMTKVSRSPMRLSRISMPENSSRYRTGYEQTLQHYTMEFGHAPPPEFWAPFSGRETNERDETTERALTECLAFGSLALTVTAVSVGILLDTLLVLVIGLIAGGGLSLIFMNRARNLRSRRFSFMGVFERRRG